MENNSAKALALFREGYNCSQSVLAGFSGRANVDDATAKSIAAGFGAGMGRLQMTCGAVTGAIMALGAALFDESDKAGSKNLIYAKTVEFVRRFEDLNGTTECLRLLGVNISVPEGQEYANRNKLFETKCEKYVENACTIVNDLLRE